MSESKDQITIQASGLDDHTAGRGSSSSTHSAPKDAAIVGVQSSSQVEGSATQPADQVDEQKKGTFAYFRTKEFYITVVLGYVPRVIFIIESPRR